MPPSLELAIEMKRSSFFLDTALKSEWSFLSVVDSELTLLDTLLPFPCLNFPVAPSSFAVFTSPRRGRIP